MNILESQTWQGVSGLLAIAAIIISIVIYRLQSTKKSIGYRVLSDSPLLRDTEVLSGKVTVHVLGSQVRYLRLIVVQFRNIGKAPIQRADFDGPIELRFSEVPTFTIASPVAVDPDSLPLVLSTAPDRVSVEPLLLNPGDSFNLQIATDQKDADLVVTARIAGVSKPIRLTDPTDETDLSLPAVVLDKIRWFAITATIVAVASSTLLSGYKDFRQVLPVLIKGLTGPK